MSGLGRDMQMEYREEVQATIWCTQDNRRIELCDLTDEHLINIILYCRNAEQSVPGEVLVEYRRREES